MNKNQVRVLGHDNKVVWIPARGISQKVAEKMYAELAKVTKGTYFDGGDLNHMGHMLQLIDDSTDGDIEWWFIPTEDCQCKTTGATLCIENLNYFWIGVVS